jgi:4-hydroxy-tetrahydrodipicolinate reductase
MNRSVKVAFYGVGVISTSIAKALLEKRGVKIIAAIDVAEGKIGRDLGDILGLPHKLDLIVEKDARKAFSKAKPDIVIHATSSSLKQVYPQISECIRAETNVVSTCEELVYPYPKNRAIANRLDRLAEKHKVSVLGTGINPGFLMDTLPITATGPCLEIRRIKVTRMMNSGRRRMPYQKKIGTGLTEKEFREKIEKREITGHVGLDSSIAMIADSLEWKLDDILELAPEPILADDTVKTDYATIMKGCVAGLRSVAYGIVGGEKAIELEFVSHARVEEEYDSIEIDGKPNVRLKIEGGIHGDVGTTAMIINSIPKVINAPPGLHTMNRLPIPSATPVELNRYVKP